MWNKKFKISFISIILWTLLMGIVIPENGSILKGIITLLLWVSFFFAFIYTINRYSSIVKNTTKASRILIYLLLNWNIINIFRSLLEGSGSLTTMFGNQYNSLSLLIPFVLSFGLFIKNLITFREILFSMVTIGIIAFPISFLFSQDYLLISVYIVLFSGSIFFIPTILQENNRHKLILIIVSFSMIFLILPENRATLIRYILLLIAVISIYIYHKYKLKIILKLAFLMLLIPVFYLYQGYNSENSIFQSLSSKSDSELTIDTRTFLYIEVFEDLINSNSLIAGKGANSTYFSQYFAENEGDSETRLTVEVGFLAILLKGGILAVVLNLSLFVYAIYLALFRSNNNYSIAIGYFLLIHVILLFVENLVAYSIYNFIVWYCVGVCLNIHFRTLSNKRIKILIYGKPNENINRNSFLQSRTIH